MVFHEEVISHGVLIPWISITQSHGPEELATTLEALQHGMRRAKKVLDAGLVDTAFEGPAPKPVFRPFNRCKQSRCGDLYPDAPALDCCSTRSKPGTSS